MLEARDLHKLYKEGKKEVEMKIDGILYDLVQKIHDSEMKHSEGRLDLLKHIKDMDNKKDKATKKIVKLMEKLK